MLTAHMNTQQRHAAGMRYLIAVCLVIVFAIAAALPAPTALADDTLKRLEQSLIVLPTGSYDRAEAARMTKRIMAIDSWILSKLVEQHVFVYLINDKVTSHPSYSYLEGVVPRGWESTGLTWDDVPGVGGSPVVVRIGYSEFGMGHGSINLELHEIAHAIDAYVLDYISGSEMWKKAQRKEQRALFGIESYYDYPEEYFAEVFAMYYLNEDTRGELRQYAPETAAILDTVTRKQQDYEQSSGQTGDIRVILFDQSLSFDQPPLMINNRTMVPLRAIFEALDSQVDWDGATSRVTAIRGDTTIQLTIGSLTAYVNNEPVRLDQPGTMINNRTLVPLRFIGEAFGLQVDWDPAQQIVTIQQ